MAKKIKYVPNIVRGGTAIPINNNTFLLRGRKHEQGGIDIGKDVEAEDGELLQINNNNIKILSNAPIMKGSSPAKYALKGAYDGTFKDRFNKGFNYQEQYKDRNHLNDDGTKQKGYSNKAKVGKFKKFLKDTAYKIITQKDVHDKGKAGPIDIITGLFNNPEIDDNKYLFIYGNDELGLYPTDTTKGKDFSKYIKKYYPKRKIEQYEGIINPYGEYIIDKNNKGLIEELANKRKHIYSNADDEYIDYIFYPSNDFYNDSVSARPYIVQLDTEYRDDVGNYPLTFDKDENGNLVGHAADLYDFNAKEQLKHWNFARAAQSAALTSVGNPYILRQNNIPIRFIDLGENRQYKNRAQYHTSTITLTDKQKRAINFDNILDYIGDEKIAEILENGYITPSTVVTDSKKLGGLKNKK